MKQLLSDVGIAISWTEESMASWNNWGAGNLHVEIRESGLVMTRTEHMSGWAGTVTGKSKKKVFTQTVGQINDREFDNKGPNNGKPWQFKCEWKSYPNGISDGFGFHQ